MTITVTDDERDERGSGIALLVGYSSRIERLLTIIERWSATSTPQRTELKKGYRALKTELKERVKRLSRLEARGELNDVQKYYVLPATLKAGLDLRPRTNSDPVGSNWCGALLGAKGCIDRLLEQLRS